MLLAPDSQSIPRVLSRSFLKNQLTGEMVFRGVLLLGIFLCIVLFQMSCSHLQYFELVFGDDGFGLLWSLAKNTTFVQELNKKSLSPVGYQPFFSYPNITIIEIIVPCFLKTWYVLDRLSLHMSVDQRFLYGVYFALVAGYASFARMWRLSRDAFVLLLNGYLVIRTFEVNYPVETVSIMGITCACVVPLHLFLDLLFVMCLCEQVVRSYRGDIKRLKVFAGCILADCFMFQLFKASQMDGFIDINALKTVMNVILFNVIIAYGAPTHWKSACFPFMILFYIYSRTCKI